jgi:hypothetical protein
MRLASIQKEESASISFIFNVLYGRNQESFDTVARIRETPSGESAGCDFSDGV